MFNWFVRTQRVSVRGKKLGLWYISCFSYSALSLYLKLHTIKIKHPLTNLIQISSISPPNRLQSSTNSVHLIIVSLTLPFLLLFFVTNTIDTFVLTFFFPTAFHPFSLIFFNFRPVWSIKNRRHAFTKPTTCLKNAFWHIWRLHVPRVKSFETFNL